MGARGEALAKQFEAKAKEAGAYIEKLNDADLKKVMLEGSGKMKTVKDLDAKGADDIVAYLRSLAKK